MEWLAGELPTSRMLLDEEASQQRRSWPNIHDWRRFVTAIEQLRTGETPDPAFEQARRHLIDECRLMMKDAPGAAAPGKARLNSFLPNESQRRMYKQYVLDYYQLYIRGKDLPHKVQMLHWAAIYQAICERTGLRDLAFHGPEFDRFIYDYCGIAYNKSAQPRGRYRTIQDLRALCIDMNSPCPQRQDFQNYRSRMVHLMIGSRPEVPRSSPSSDVPRLFDDL